MSQRIVPHMRKARKFAFQYYIFNRTGIQEIEIVGFCVKCLISLINFLIPEKANENEENTEIHLYFMRENT